MAKKYKWIKPLELKELKNHKQIEEVILDLKSLKDLFSQTKFDSWKKEIISNFFQRVENIKTSNIEGIATTVDEAYIVEEIEQNNWSKKLSPWFKDNLILNKNFLKVIETWISKDIKKLTTEDLKKIHYELFKEIDNPKIIKKPIGQFKQEQNFVSSIDQFGISKKIYEACRIDEQDIELSKLLNLINKPETDLKQSLIDVAIIHALYERIHPFEDGNGRLGRILIPISFAIKTNHIYPDLFLSFWINETRAEYYDSLMSISFSDSYDYWVDYFLKIFSKTILTYKEFNSRININFEKLKDILKENKTPFIKNNYEIITKVLLSKPMFSFNSFLDLWKKFEKNNIPSKNTLLRIFTNLQENNIIKLLPSEKLDKKKRENQRNRLFKSEYFVRFDE